MPGDAEATKRRLIDAATTEFAAYGIAGARVDRIAEQAGANKAQIYHYFGSKDELFNAVFDAQVVRTVTEIPIDALDLPEYAGRLFDGYETHPEQQRLATWYRLERAGTEAPLEKILQSSRDKIAAISKAQKSGRLTDRFNAGDLLMLVLSIAATWATTVPEFDVLVSSKRSRAHRRQVVVDAVAALIS